MQETAAAKADLDKKEGELKQLHRKNRATTGPGADWVVGVAECSQTIGRYAKRLSERGESCKKGAEGAMSAGSAPRRPRRGGGGIGGVVCVCRAAHCAASVVGVFSLAAGGGDDRLSALARPSHDAVGNCPTRLGRSGNQAYQAGSPAKIRQAGLTTAGFRLMMLSGCRAQWQNDNSEWNGG